MFTAKKDEIDNLEYVGLIDLVFALKLFKQNTIHWFVIFRFFFIDKPLLTSKVESLPRFGSFCKFKIGRLTFSQHGRFLKG